ncbi:unnamed protein product, partial [Laminaria digitata]
TRDNQQSETPLLSTPASGGYWLERLAPVTSARTQPEAEGSVDPADPASSRARVIGTPPQGVARHQMSTTHPYKYHPQTAESVVTAQQSPGMDASSAAAWSWSRVDSPIINRHAIINSHTINSHTADNSYLAPTEAGAAVQQVVVHKKMR